MFKQFLFLFFTPFILFAQNNPAVLPEVVVTATTEESLTVPSAAEAEKEINNIPGGANVVTDDEIRTGRTSNMKDALEYSPGVYIQPRFGSDESRISIRGSGVQRTFHGRGIKLLQDGVPVNLADGGFDFQMMEPLSTNYIEVFRGANALRYGATTLGGAVNYVSYTGHTASPTQARFELGSFGYYKAQISSGMVLGPLDYYVSLMHSNQDGFREHSQQNNQRLYANVGYQINDNIETRFYLTYAQSDSELPGNLSKDQLEHDPTAAQRNPFFADADYVLSNWKRDIQLFRIANKTSVRWDESQLDFSTFWAWKDLDHPIIFVIDQLSNDVGGELRYTNRSNLFGRENEFVLGTSYVYGITQDNRFDNVLGNRGLRLSDSQQTAFNLDVYAENRHYVLPKLALVTGLQWSYANRTNRDDFKGGGIDHSDEQEFYGWNPKLGFLYRITDNASIFVNISRSFEPPSFGELVNPIGGGNGLIALEPQTATTFEIGTRGKEGRFEWDLSYYYAWIDDELLSYEVLPGSNITLNAADTRHQGVEAYLAVDLFKNIFAKEERSEYEGKSVADNKSTVAEKEGDCIALRQNYLWSDFRFENDPVFGDNHLAGLPEHYYRAELVYKHPCGFYLGPNVEWILKKYSVDFANTLFADPYALFGFKIGYRSKRGFSAFVEGRNLFDKIYASTTGVVPVAAPDAALFMPGDGRGIYAGVEWKW